MLNLASLCFPDHEKSCFYCCPPIRNPEADPLDAIADKQALLRNNSKDLQKNLSTPHEISGMECWGLGFLDDQEKQAGCLLHPLRHQGRDLRHLTGYQFKCANALCQEALIFAELSETEQNFCLALCQDMDSFHYSSRSNPLMQLLAWDKDMVQIVIRKSLDDTITNQKSNQTKQDSGPTKNRETFIAKHEFLWQKLDFRLDSYLSLKISERKGFNFLRNNLDDYIRLRNDLISELKKKTTLSIASAPPLIPVHKLKIPLNLSRLLKFGADLWELPSGSEKEIFQTIEDKLKNF